MLPSRAVRRLLPLLFLIACSDSAPEDTTSNSGYDEAIDPAELAEAQKADGDPCAEHPGGPVDGADLLALINKEALRLLRADYAPNDLLPVGSQQVMPGREALLRISALQGLEALLDAGLLEGYDLRVRSAYRSFRTQCHTFQYWVRTKGREHADRFSAQPGRSQHQLGTTIDLTAETWGWEIEPHVADTEEARWLAANAWRHGFALSYPDDAEALTGYAFEPWHYRYIGREAASEMAEQGLLLEEYLRACDAGREDLKCPRELVPEVPVNKGFIGGTCGADEDCASLGEEAVCLSEGYPGGHCTLPCTRGCPDRAGRNALTFCVAARPTDSSGFCHSQCDFEIFPDSGCRSDYACLDGQRPNQGREAEVCRPD